MLELDMIMIITIYIYILYVNMPYINGEKYNIYKNASHPAKGRCRGI